MKHLKDGVKMVAERRALAPAYRVWFSAAFGGQLQRPSALLQSWDDEGFKDLQS